MFPHLHFRVGITYRIQLNRYKFPMQPYLKAKESILRSGPEAWGFIYLSNAISLDLNSHVSDKHSRRKGHQILITTLTRAGVRCWQRLHRLAARLQCQCREWPLSRADISSAFCRGLWPNRHGAYMQVQLSLLHFFSSFFWCDSSLILVFNLIEGECCL